MKSQFRIFQLMNKLGETYLIDTQKERPELFRYHDESGSFESEDKAMKWVSGLGMLKGQFIILKVLSK